MFHDPRGPGTRASSGGVRDAHRDRVGTVQVQRWLDHLGTTSVVYGFRVLSDDGTVVHAEGRRVQVRLDPATLRPAAIGPELREPCRPLLAGAEPGARAAA